MVCVGCCCRLDENTVGCPKCNWPMCGSSNCWQQGSQHAQGECVWLKEDRFIAHSSHFSPKEFYLTIMVLRCLSLRDRDPLKWEKFMALRKSGSPGGLKGLDKKEQSVVLKLINQWVPETVFLKEWIINICAVFLFNNFSLPEISDHQCEGLCVSIWS